jgi:hypothetical protein
MLDILSKQKEAKIEKVRHLIPKYYDEGSFVSPIKLVSRISRMLKPNQWLRVEDAKHGVSFNRSKILKIIFSGYADNGEKLEFSTFIASLNIGVLTPITV